MRRKKQIEEILLSRGTLSFLKLRSEDGKCTRMKGMLGFMKTSRKVLWILTINHAVEKRILYPKVVVNWAFLFVSRTDFWVFYAKEEANKINTRT